MFRRHCQLLAIAKSKVFPPHTVSLPWQRTVSKTTSLQVEVKDAILVLKIHRLFSAPSTKVRTWIYLLFNRSPSSCFDTKKTQGKSVSNTVLSPLGLLMSKPKTLQTAVQTEIAK